MRRAAGFGFPGAGCGCALGPMVVVGVVVFVFVWGFLGILYAAGSAVIPEGLRGPFEAWMRGVAPDDPAYILVAEAAPPGAGPLPGPPAAGPLPPGPCGFAWPLAPGVGAVTQPFIPGRHWGVDIGIPEGTPVYAPADGTVLWAGWLEGGYGVAVMVGAGERRFILAHLSRPLVRAGEAVRTGQEVGLSGNTGRSTGPHLHFEVWVGGGRVDPLSCREVGAPAPAAGGGGGGFFTAAGAVGFSLPPGREGRAFAFAGPAGDGVAVAVSDPAFYVWPAGRPDLAVAGGARIRGAAAVEVGPRPGEAWVRLPGTDGVFWAVAIY